MVEECFKCGISEEKVRLFDAISEKGIVKICKECSQLEDMPVINKPTTLQLKESEAKAQSKSVYERLSKMSGFDPKNYVVNNGGLPQQDVSLRDLVDKNFEREVKEKIEPREDLIHNFHWVIMRARRSKKLTREQLAREIAEAVSAVKMAEQGILPEDDYKLINKLEAFLGIKIRKAEAIPQLEDKEKDLSFDPMATKTITISDLKKIKEEKNGGLFDKSEEVPVPEEELEIEDEEEDRLSDEEFDDLIWKK